MSVSEHEGRDDIPQRTASCRVCGWETWDGECDACSRRKAAMSKVLSEVEHERERQQAKGWTPEHDDEHPTSEMVGFIVERTKPQCMTTPHRIDDEWDAARRKSLIEIAALAVAAVESLDRATFDAVIHETTRETK